MSSDGVICGDPDPKCPNCNGEGGYDSCKRGCCWADCDCVAKAITLTATAQGRNASQALQSIEQLIDELSGQMRDGVAYTIGLPQIERKGAAQWYVTVSAEPTRYEKPLEKVKRANSKR